MTGRIPATVITGFLGAGKTTLIQNLLRQSNGKKIALVINEFGDLGVDGALLSDCGDAACSAEDVVELANGCICCTVADDFIPTMEMLLNRDPAPDHIVIETSGMALPQPLVQAFNWPEVRSRVTVDGVVTVVDSPAVAEGKFAANVAAVEVQRADDDNLDHESPLHELFEDQLICADLVVLNKTDQIEGAALESVKVLVEKEKRSAARIVQAVHGDLPPALVIGQGIGAEDDLATRKSHHDGEDHEPHDHDDFDSFVVRMPESVSPDDLARLVNNVMERSDVLRAKGFAAVSGKPMRLAVQAVGPRVETYFDRPWHKDETREGRLVVIGLTGLDRQQIAKSLNGVAT